MMFSTISGISRYSRLANVAVPHAPHAQIRPQMAIQFSRLLNTRPENTGIKVGAEVEKSRNSFSLLNHSGKNYSIYAAAVAILMGIGIYSSGKKVVKIFNGKETNFPKNLSSAEMEKMTKQLVEEEDREAILKLLKLLDIPDHFLNIEKYLLWESDLCDALIEKENGNLIRGIFPHISKQTLSDYTKFYAPIKQGKLELIKAMSEGGMLLKSDRTDFLLYALFTKQTAVAEYFLSLPEYDINCGYPFTTKETAGTGEDFVSLSEYDINCAHPLTLCTIEEKKDDRARIVYDTITPAYLAVALEDLDLLKWLIDKGANCSALNQCPNKCRMSNHDEDNPLILAARRGFKECFSSIVDLDCCDINVQGHFNRTPLFTALCADQYEIARLLIEKGADVNLDSNGKTPLEYTVSGANTNLDILMIKDLLKAGANVRTSKFLGKTLWHYAVDGFRVTEIVTEICELLLKNDIQDMIDDEDILGRTPLTKAIVDCKSEAFEALLKCGANPSKILTNLENDSKRSYNLWKNEITLEELVQGVKFKLKENLEKSSFNKEYYLKRLEELEKITILLANPPKKIDITRKVEE